MNNESHLSNLPENCGHSEWVINCPRCFFEMKGLADGNIRADMLEAEIKGAILFNWHVLTVLENMERQLGPLTRSIDLSKVSLAKDLIANLQQLGIYFIRLVADPMRLGQALELAAVMAKAAKERMEELKERGEEPRQGTARAVASSIVLTDGGI